MQLFSMARQMPVLEEGAWSERAEWYLALRMQCVVALTTTETSVSCIQKRISLRWKLPSTCSQRRTYPTSLLRCRQKDYDLVQMVDFMAGVLHP